MKVIVVSGKAQHGKDSTARIFKEIAEEDGKKVLITHYADYLKYICKEWFGWDGKKDDKGRTILQHVGTNLARTNHENVWVNVVIESLKAFGEEYDYVLIPDCRYINEIEMMKDNFDTLSMRVERIGFESKLTHEQKNHISEVALDNYNFDYMISVLGGVEYLETEVRMLYEAMRFADASRMEVN
jgi:hypothetical protein